MTPDDLAALHHLTFSTFLYNFAPLFIFGLIIGGISLMFGEAD